MEAQAILRNCPMSARKMRLVVDLIRERSVDDALNILKFTKKEAAEWLEKVVLSAISNWENKTNLTYSAADYDLYIKEVFSNEAGFLKRFRPAPQGRAHRIRKRSNHVTLVVENRIEIDESNLNDEEELLIMGQKTNPIGNRLGIIKGWESNWYGGKDFAAKVIQDEKIRSYLKARVPKGGLARIIIERTLKRITLTVHTSRPGIIIGRGGQEVDRIREELKKLTSQDVQINIFEIRKPELDATIVADNIARQLEARMNFRRVAKMSIQNTMRGGAQGIKVKISGRLNGAEMARSEQFKDGRIPLHTFRADVDYALVEALTVYGKLGVKVWIFKGEVLGKRDLSPNVGVENNKRRGGGRRKGGVRRQNK